MIALVRMFSTIWLCFRLLAFSVRTTHGSPTVVHEAQSIDTVKGCWVFRRNAKSGTSTIARILEDWGERHGIQIAKLDWETWEDVDKRKGFLSENHTLIAGGFQEALYGVGGGRNCSWLTILRHPIPRLVSAFYYCKYKVPQDIICNDGPLDVRNADFPTFAKFWSNMAMRFIILGFVKPDEVRH